MRTDELQQRLTALGFKPGQIDGIYGTLTEEAVFDALDKYAPPVEVPEPPPPSADMDIIPDDWLSDCHMARIIVHWTAGSHKASENDREHYHILIEGDGSLVRGTHTIADNISTGDNDYAAHTKNSNTESIGVSLCCMADAQENPFSSGKYPMTKTQWDVLTSVCAQLCEFYDIDPTPKELLSHGEVQANLGIAQDGKWDYTRLSFDPSVVGAKACGDKLRKETADKL